MRLAGTSSERRATVEWNTITAQPPIVVHVNDGMPLVVDFEPSLHGDATLESLVVMTADSCAMGHRADGCCPCVSF